MHWSIAQYCIYAICGVAFALMAFNEHLPLSIISGLDLVMPRKHYSLAKNIVHAACLFSICCTVISSIGALIMMISPPARRGILLQILCGLSQNLLDCAPSWHCGFCHLLSQ